jgi:hypothetical protein
VGGTKFIDIACGCVARAGPNKEEIRFETEWHPAIQSLVFLVLKLSDDELNSSLALCQVQVGSRRLLIKGREK